MDLDRLARDALPLDFSDRRVGERVRDEADAGKRAGVERLLDPLRPLSRDVGESHAVGREQ